MSKMLGTHKAKVSAAENNRYRTSGSCSRLFEIFRSKEMCQRSRCFAAIAMLGLTMCASPTLAKDNDQSIRLPDLGAVRDNLDITVKSFHDTFIDANELVKRNRCYNFLTKAFWGNLWNWKGRNVSLKDVRTKYSLPEDFNEFATEYLGEIMDEASGGKSGSGFYKTRDGKFLIKEVPGSGKVLQSGDYFTIMKTDFVEKYINHITDADNEDSLLVRYFGFFTAKEVVDGRPGRVKCWSIMNTCYTKKSTDADKLMINSDLKGSLSGRIWTTKKKTFKDLDMAYLIERVETSGEIENKEIANVWKAMVKDIKFLKQCGVMDYSWIPRIEVTRQQHEEKVSDEELSTLPSSKKIPVKLSIKGVENDVEAILNFGGIIDFLQRSNYKKKMERIYQCNKVEHSARGSHQYADRFLLFASKFFPRNIVKRGAENNGNAFGRWAKRTLSNVANIHDVCNIVTRQYRNKWLIPEEARTLYLNEDGDFKSSYVVTKYESVGSYDSKLRSYMTTCGANEQYTSKMNSDNNSASVMQIDYFRDFSEKNPKAQAMLLKALQSVAKDDDASSDEKTINMFDENSSEPSLPDEDHDHRSRLSRSLTRWFSKIGSTFL